ncbi:hypothetical protein HYU91_04355 [Candidatus Collierbacteria bacterium]|nr:hypothetical protein [Candidatus Collierbacteria bacterium]
MDNNKVLSLDEKISKARDLLERAALESPAAMLMVETVLASKAEDKIDEVLVILEKRVKELRDAYAGFKGEIAEIVKQTLPPKA